MSWKRNARPGSWQAAGRAQAAARGGSAVGSILSDADIAYNQRGQVAGRFVRDRAGSWRLVKRGLSPERHMLRRPRGWATDREHLDELRRRGGLRALVELRDTHGRVWTASLAQFDRYGLAIDRGHGRQVVLAERFWRVEAPGAVQPALFSALDAAGGGA